MEYQHIIEKIKSLSDPEAIKGMARYGINTKNSYGVSVSYLRKLAKEIGKDSALSRQLWAAGIHETRILACLVEDPLMVTEEQLESWVSGFDSWDTCDLCCSHLFDKTQYAYQKAVEWSERDEEFVKRAEFVLMAALAVHDKKASDEELAKFLPIIKRESTDNRNFVKKAVNWALRQIGKRNLNLNKIAVNTAGEISQIDSKSARWIAADAIRELTGDAVQKRLKKEKQTNTK